MINITLENGTIKKYIKSITPYDISKEIYNKDLLKEVIFATNNIGEQIDLFSPLYNDTKLVLHTLKSNLGKKVFWNSSAYLLAKSILDIYPNVKLVDFMTMNNGFYYDIDFNNELFSQKDFFYVEKKMQENADKYNDFKLFILSKKDALIYFKNNFYKKKIIEPIKEDVIPFCIHDNFADICLLKKYISNTKLIKSVKILNISGIYWDSNINKKQITRIYCISFPNKKGLKSFIKTTQESKKNDHREIGKKLNLFSFSDKVGKGLPMWLPNGVILRKQLENFLIDLQYKSGYEMVITPHIAHKDLYIKSGHWDKYAKNSFKPIMTPYKEEFILKPMNCPHHCEIYKTQKWSYRDLPKRFSEFGTVYRYEQSGELHGLTRVRSFTQDDAHIFCTQEQLLEEFKSVIKLVLYVLKSLGFNNFEAQISVRDNDSLDKYVGTDLKWKEAERAIIKATEEKKLKTKLVYGEAAFYGPKLDFMVNDNFGRNWQLGTIQVDYNLPERFDLYYQGSDNKLHRPVIIHRAPFGSLERFIAVLLEHTCGNLPLWLTPYQVIIITISKKHINYARNVLNLLYQSNIRVFIDDRNERMKKKIRDAEVQKIPFIIILGDNEEKNNLITVRKHGQKNSKIFDINSLVKIIEKEICLKTFN